MRFSCETCNYSTDVKYCYETHLKTKKHKEKVDKEMVASKQHATSIKVESKKFKCPFCENSYATAGNLAKHKRTCIEKNVLVDQHEKQLKDLQEELARKNELFAKEIAYRDELLASKNELLAKEIASKNELIASKNETIAREIANKTELVTAKDNNIDILTAESKNLKVLLNCAGTLVEKSLTNYNYITKNYNEAPVLKLMTDNPTLMLEFGDDKYVQNIVAKHINNTLIEFIGKIILKNYKKEDPKQQSIWNSDVDRLTYAIRTLLNDKNCYWKVDKKGIDVTQHIIKPIADFINNELHTYLDNMGKMTRRNTNAEITAYNDMMESINEILDSINKEELHDKILKYISPYFFVTREEATLS